MFENLEQLIKIIRARKNSSPDKSYTNKLLNDKNLSVSKVKEEIAELIDSVEKNSNKVHEASCTLFEFFSTESINSAISSFTFETLKFLSLRSLFV